MYRYYTVDVPMVRDAPTAPVIALAVPPMGGLPAKVLCKRIHKERVMFILLGTKPNSKTSLRERERERVMFVRTCESPTIRHET